MLPFLNQFWFILQRSCHMLLSIAACSLLVLLPVLLPAFLLDRSRARTSFPLGLDASLAFPAPAWPICISSTLPKHLVWQILPTGCHQRFRGPSCRDHHLFWGGILQRASERHCCSHLRQNLSSSSSGVKSPTSCGSTPKSQCLQLPWAEPHVFSVPLCRWTKGLSSPMQGGHQQSSVLQWLLSWACLKRHNLS